MQYQPQAPLRNAWPACEPRNVEKSRLLGPVTNGTPSKTAAAMISGIRISQILPPTRPLRGLCGDRSQSASRVVVQRSVPCSCRSSAATRTNCQIRPAAKHTIRALTIGTFPVPAKLSLSAGATSQASAPIGSAAAAHIARIRRIPYCGMATFAGAWSAVEDTAPAVDASDVFIVLSFVVVNTTDAMGQARQAHRREAGFRLVPGGDSVSYLSRRRGVRICSTFTA